MRDRKSPEPVGADPIILPLETDARIRLRADVSRLLQDRGVDRESGAPSPEELQALVLAMLERFLQDQAFIVDARVTWLDVELMVRSEW